MPRHASTSTVISKIHGAKAMLCIWWDQLGVMYYELFKSSENITGYRYRTQLMRLSRALMEKWPQYQDRYAQVILQLDNARPHVARPVKIYLETLNMFRSVSCLRYNNGQFSGIAKGHIFILFIVFSGRGTIRGYFGMGP